MTVSLIAVLCLYFIPLALAANSKCDPRNNLQRCFLSPSQLATPYYSSFCPSRWPQLPWLTSISWVVSCRECRRCYSFVSAISLSQRQFLLGQMLPFQRNFWLHTPKWSSRQQTQSVSCVLFMFPSFFTLVQGCYSESALSDWKSELISDDSIGDISVYRSTI